MMKLRVKDACCQRHVAPSENATCHAHVHVHACEIVPHDEKSKERVHRVERLIA